MIVEPVLNGDGLFSWVGAEVKGDGLIADGFPYKSVAILTDLDRTMSCLRLEHKATATRSISLSTFSIYPKR